MTDLSAQRLTIAGQIAAGLAQTAKPNVEGIAALALEIADAVIILHEHTLKDFTLTVQRQKRRFPQWDAP